MKIRFNKFIAPIVAMMLVLSVMATGAVADTTLTATASQGVNVAKTADALAAGQSFILTEVVGNSLGKSTPTIEFALDNGAKFNWALVDFAGNEFEAVQTSKVTGLALAAAATGRYQTFTVAGIIFTVEVWDTGTTAADALTLTNSDGTTFAYSFVDGATADDDVIIIHANGAVISAVAGADTTPTSVTVTAAEVGAQIDSALSTTFGGSAVDDTPGDADVTFYEATANTGLALMADPAVGATTNGTIISATAGDRFITINTAGSIVITNLVEETTSAAPLAGITVSNIHLNTSASTVGTPVALTIGSGTTDVGVTTQNTFTLVTPQSKGATIVGTATTLPILAKGVVSTVGNTIKITESIAASITDVSAAVNEIVVTLPETLVITAAGATTSNDNFTTDDGTAVGNVATYNVTGTATTSAGKVILGDTTAFSVLVPLDYASGDVTAAVVVKLSDGTTVSADVPLFNVSDKGSINTAVNASNVAITTFSTVYAGRATQNTSAFLKIAETVGASLINGANIQLDLPTGVTFGTDYDPSGEVVADGTGIPSDPSFAGKTDGTTADETGVSAMLMKLNSTDANTTAGNIKVQFNDLDLTDTAAAGDLNVTLSGNAGLTAGTVKIADVLTATTTTVSTMPTAVKTVKVAVGDIMIQENKAAALVGGSAVMFLRFPTTVTLDTAATLTVKTKPASAVESTTLVTGSIVDAQTVKLTVVTASTTGSGAYAITVSGLMATAGSTATTGDLTFSIAGDADGTYDAPGATSDVGAKPWKQSVAFASVISDTLLTVSAPVATATDVTVTLTPAGNNLNQVGDWYVTAGSQFYDGSAWVDAETAFETGATLAEKTFTVSTEGLAVGTKIFIGYGVGLVNTFTSMNSNGTFALAYTVPEPAPAFSATPTTVQFAATETKTVSVANGTAPYTIAVTDDAVATSDVATLDAAGDFVLTAVADGTTTVTVTDSSATPEVITINVTVAVAVPMSVDVTTLAVSLDATGTVTISGGVAPFAVASSDETVATATVDGTAVTVSGLVVGTATLTITDSATPAGEVTVAVTVSGAIIPLPTEPTVVAPTTPETIALAPIFMGEVATNPDGNKMDLTMNFPGHEADVDLYAAVMLPDGVLWFIDSADTLSRAAVAFRTAVTAPQAATLFSNFEVCTPFGTPALPEGTWSAFWLTVPANGGELSLIDFSAESTDAYVLGFYSFETSCAPAAE